MAIALGILGMVITVSIITGVVIHSMNRNKDWK